MSLGSPHFSHSAKVDILNKLSPSGRNNRIPSSHEGYSASQWNRVNSSKKLDSPTKFSQKKRKRSQNSQSRTSKRKQETPENLVTEVTFLKDQYKALKEAYHDLISEKVKNANQMSSLKEQNLRIKKEKQKLSKETQKMKAKISFLEIEIERIKKQSYKIIEIQQFKAKKLEESLSQKEKAIHQLLNTLKDQSIKNEDNIVPDISYTFQTKDKKLEVPLDSSFSISHNKTFSNQSQFISISLTSMMENQSQFPLSTKRIPEHVKLQTLEENNDQSSQKQVQKLNTKHIQKIRSNTQERVLSEMKKFESLNNKSVETINQKNIEQGNLKKIRKELSKKLDINIDQKHKEYAQVLGCPKTPLDRKVSRSQKGSRTKLKKDDEKQNSDVKSSKKKIIHR